MSDVNREALMKAGVRLREAAGLIKQAGDELVEASVGDEPPVVPPPEPEPPEDEEPPSHPDVDGLDLQAVADLWHGPSKPTQLVRPRERRGHPKVEVYGPKTRPTPDGRDAEPSTAGFGDSVHEALEDYERKTRDKIRPSFRALTPEEIDAVIFYLTRPANKNNSIRKDNRGEWHLDSTEVPSQKVDDPLDACRLLGWSG